MTATHSMQITKSTWKNRESRTEKHRQRKYHAQNDASQSNHLNGCRRYTNFARDNRSVAQALTIVVTIQKQIEHGNKEDKDDGNE